MAINPNTVNILNIDELNNASSIGNDDLIVIGQGIYARKSTVYQLYQKFGLENLEDAVFELQQQQGDIDLSTVVRVIPQAFQQSEVAVARNNIGAIDRRLNDLSADLQENEQKEIQNKLGFSFEGFVKNLEYKEGENEWRYEIVGEDTIIVPIVPQFIIDKIQTLENSIPPRKDRQSDSFNVTAGDIVNDRIKKDLTHVPVAGSLFVFVRGVFIDEDAYTLTGKEITILSNRYEIKEGDLISARYEYLITE